jgi:hypothetical protein
MSAEHAVDTPALEEGRTSLTHVVAGALRRYGLGAAQPVLLDDTTNLVFRILPEVRGIDFDDYGWGYYTYDMAVTLSYLEAPSTFPALQDAFLTGYQRVRPLPRRYAECLEVFLAARILPMVSWILRWPQRCHLA